MSATLQPTNEDTNEEKNGLTKEQMFDWIARHLTTLKMGIACSEMSYIDDEGYSRVVEVYLGRDFRDGNFHDDDSYVLQELIKKVVFAK